MIKRVADLRYEHPCGAWYLRVQSSLLRVSSVTLP
jgi:hypothetical protein